MFEVSRGRHKLVGFLHCFIVTNIEAVVMHFLMSLLL